MSDRDHTEAAGRTEMLSAAFNPRRNSLGFLRILFASLVLLDHAFPLGGFHQGVDPMWNWSDQQESFGGLAVAGFFVVSGFLVTRSFDSSRSTLNYMWKRFLRIFPGFWVCLLVTAAVFGPIAFIYQNGSLAGYLRAGPESAFGYFWHNSYLVMNQYNIDGVLKATPYSNSHFPQALDGSLWTLIYEVKCYFAVAILGVVGAFRSNRFAVVVVTLGLWAAQLEDQLHPGKLQGWPLIGDPQMMRLGFIFSLGALLYLYREKVPFSDGLAAAAAIMLVVSMRTALYSGLGLFAFAYLCMWLAVRLPLHGFDRIGDFSYGIYIYAFPVEQIFSLYGVNRWGLLPYLLLCLGGTLVLAVPSWFFVERPCLQLKRIRFPIPRAFPSLRAAKRSPPETDPTLAASGGPPVAP